MSAEVSIGERPAVIMTPGELARFRAKYTVDPATGCWLWRAAKFKTGYAAFSFRGRPQTAHSVSYRHFVGAVPAGEHLDHLCRVRHCVNPKHLQPVTPRVNNLRSTSPTAANLRKTHCPRGHAYTVANTWVNTQGKRWCRACNRIKASLRYRARCPSSGSSEDRSGRPP